MYSSNQLVREKNMKWKLVICLLFVFSFFGCKNPKEDMDNHKYKETTQNQKEENVQIAKFTPIEFRMGEEYTFLELKKLQTRYKALIQNGMLKFSLHSKANHLRSLFEKDSFFAPPAGRHAVLNIELKNQKKKAKGPESFLVVVMPTKYAKFYPSSVVVIDRTIRVIADFKTLEWLTIVFLHEMVHMEDVVKKRFKNGVHNEVKAHLFENELLQVWNTSGYNQMIEEGKKAMSDIGLDYSKLQQHHRLKFRSIASKYYPLSNDVTTEEERSLGYAACIFAILFENSPDKTKIGYAKAYEAGSKLITGKSYKQLIAR